MNNYLKVKVEGKNINNYLKWLIKNKINIINLKIIKHNELNLIIDYHDYNKLFKYSKTYKITIIKKYGKLRLLDIIKSNIIIISCLMFSIVFLYFLSNIIFSVKVIYNDQTIIDKITKELSIYDIKKYKFKKNYNYLEKVKKELLERNKDILEWIEIEENGTEYIIKLVERKKEIKNNSYKYQSIIAKKDAIITKINATSGEKTKEIGSYVKKGETVISGILTKPDNTNIYTKATGSIYGEIWYKVKISYPLYYQEEKLTGKNKSVISFYFLNNKILAFPYKKYKQFKITSTSILESNIIPFKIAKERMYEVIIKEEIYTIDSAINIAIEYAKNKMKENNKNIISFNNVSILSKQSDSSKINLTIFISVIEDITDIKEIYIENYLQ